MGSCIRQGNTNEYEIIQIQPVLTARISTDSSYDTKKELVASHYTFGKVIGRGSYGQVRKAYPVFKPVSVVAIKSLKKMNSRGETKKSRLKKELEILRALDHPNVVRFFESFEDSRYIHIVTEYCPGGSLEGRVLEHGAFSEQFARRCFTSILRTLHYLHTNGVCHRDIKASNFLFEENELKLIDFGLSTCFEPGTEMVTKAGTPYYMSPEVLQGKPYTQSSDLWSVGVLLYYLLHGCLPFVAESRPLLYSLITEGRYTVLSDLSLDSQDLIARLLIVDPEQRLSAEQALRHPWLLPESPLMNIDANLLIDLSEFHNQSALDQVLRKVLAKYLSGNRARELKKAFLQLDTQNKGTLSVGTKRVRYNEFLAASVHRVVDEGYIRKCFDYLENDKNDAVSSMDLLKVIDIEEYTMHHSIFLRALKELDELDPPVLHFADLKARINIVNRLY